MLKYNWYLPTQVRFWVSSIKPAQQLDLFKKKVQPMYCNSWKIKKNAVLSKLIAFQTYLLFLHGKCTEATKSKYSKDSKRAVWMINFFMAGIFLYTLCGLRYVYNLCTYTYQSTKIRKYHYLICDRHEHANIANI